MYQPRAFVETDLAQLDALFAIDPFVTLVTHDEAGASFASHLPVLYQRDGERIHIEGHWARPNPQAIHPPEALMIVHGPHAYVSPGWYPDKLGAGRVPTWNYAVAHLRGRFETFADEASLADLVSRLSSHFEATVGSDWEFDPTDARQHALLRGIVGFRFVLDQVDIKFKLSQNHPAANVRGAAAGLRALGGEDNLEIAGMMLGHLPPG